MSVMPRSAAYVDERPQVELTLVKGNRQRVIPQLRGAVDQLIRGVRNVVDRIVRRVRMQIDFQHASGLLKILAADGSLKWLGLSAELGVDRR